MPLTFVNGDKLRYSKTGVRWLCDCGEGTGVRKDDEDEDAERAVKWKPRTPYHILSESVSYREHLRLVHKLEVK